MILKDYLAKLPIEVIKKIEVFDNKITLPIKIDITEFYKLFKTEIKQPTLTVEKAIFVANKYLSDVKFKSSIDLLNSKLRF